MFTKDSGGTATLEESVVAKNKHLVERYSDFKSKDLGIVKPINVFEPLGEDACPMRKAQLATLCENFVKKATDQRSIVETDRGGLPVWIKNGLALISASFTEDLSDQVISMQPMSSKRGKVHYLNVQAERSKGAIAQTTQLIKALSGFRGSQHFSDEKVVDEPAGGSGATNYTLTTGYTPVMPGTFKMTDGTLTITDDGNGNLVGDTGAGTNTINYVTGAVNGDFSAATIASVTMSYEYNIEAALSLPEVGIALESVDVEARPRALAAAWSQQAVFDFLNDFGMDAEPTIIDAASRVITSERFKHIVNTLRNAATGGAMVFDNAAPAAVPYILHAKTFSITVSRLQNLIWEKTQSVRPNVMVIAPDIWFLLGLQDGFEGESNVANDGLSGPRKVGRLTRHGIEVFADPTFPSGKAVMTYRGSQFVNTAAIVGTYIPLYRSPIHSQGFRKDIALLTEYALHIVDSDQMGTIDVVNL